MKQVELLAPAGTMDALKAAVHNGCDAVYLGGSMFGARAFAGNFNNDEMKDAIRYAHTYDVKVYVTMNTLIFEDEIDDAYNYAKFLYEIGVDALIIQDIGLFDRLRIQLPNLELHVSTQMHIHHREGIRLMKEKGAKRIVLPRETEIEQVREFAQEGIDLEVFVHGALCVSYSGQCLMSEALFQRSGNRGECAQACRMKYQLVKEDQGKENIISTEGEYILSPKDLNTLSHIPELIDAGVASFKIEGRMKRPEYVAQVVSLYRQAIDAALRNQKFHYQEDMRKDMQLIFNRQFTKGYLFHDEGKQIMHALRPNHMGIVIGKVLWARKKRIAIALQDTIHQGDGIRILQSKEDQGFVLNKIYKNGLLVNSASKNDVIEIACDQFIETNAMVVKTSDILQLQRLRDLPSRKRKIHMHGVFHIGEPMQLTIRDDAYTVTGVSEHCIERAKTSFVDKERIKAQLMKCRDTPFQVESIELDIDEQCFISIKEVNQLRREAIEAFEKRLENLPSKILELPYWKKLDKYGDNVHSTILIVHTKEQYNACVQEKMYPAYTTSKKLAKEYQLQYCAGAVVEQQDTSDLVCEMGGLSKNNALICEPSLYAANSYSCAYLQEQGIKQVILPYELSDERMRLLISSYQQKYPNTMYFGIEVYGYRDLMIMKYCPIQTFESGKKYCNYCHMHSYYLKDIKGQRFPLIGDEECHMRILSFEPYKRIKDMKSFQNMDITSYQLRFTIETFDVVVKVLQEYKGMLQELGLL